jgi:hypothetical protein
MAAAVRLVAAPQGDELLALADTGSAGDKIELTVRSTASKLLVHDENDVEITVLDVTAGKATLTIPADKKTGNLRVTDATSDTKVKITVTEKQ